MGTAAERQGQEGLIWQSDLLPGQIENRFSGGAPQGLERRVPSSRMLVGSASPPSPAPAPDPLDDVGIGGKGIVEYRRRRQFMRPLERRASQSSPRLSHRRSGIGSVDADDHGDR